MSESGKQVESERIPGLSLWDTAVVGLSLDICLGGMRQGWWSREAALMWVMVVLVDRATGRIIKALRDLA